ncbi:hypothetical protein MSAN_00165500 [Mycena sanguinolenta]|uniref:Uncharacterized protein n=1 Tax=Mycena sanguinolenta TaxID=230812 RepID=A0A8H6ZED7_9AGAR|nr:hypothetical protein MSAN_00165500 [Mycena sanguinolenta]
MNSVLPLKFPRLITLFLAWAWSLISFSIGVNAFVKSKQDKNQIVDKIPFPTNISINTNDITQAGAVVTTISVLILILTTLYIALMVIDANARSGISTRTLRLQYISLSFLAIALFATEIPVSLFVSTRSAKVSASVDGFNLSDGTLKTIERALGAQTAYKDFSYLKLLAILPWFTFIFTLAAAIVSFLASSDSRSTSRRKGSKPLPDEPKSAGPATAA